MRSQTVAALGQKWVERVAKRYRHRLLTFRCRSENAAVVDFSGTVQHR